MSRRASGYLVTALAGLTYVSIPAARPTRAAPEEPLSFRDVREIELSAIYSTSTQKNLKDVYCSLKEESPERQALFDIGDALERARSPAMVTVVRGDDIREAVLAASRFVKAMPRPEKPIGPNEKSASKSFWIFAYLGHAHSTPHNWLVFPPTMFGEGVRFMYTPFDGWLSDEPISEATGYRAYLYWVPLGSEADPRKLKAELVELAKKVTASYPAAK